MQLDITMEVSMHDSDLCLHTFTLQGQSFQLG